jgi:hypothetical protein
MVNSSMNENMKLRDAKAQDIQLELIRRTAFNAFDGERIYDSLTRNRHLWSAVLLDRPGIPNYSEPSNLLMSGLIKLRDLPGNYWNADTLFVLTKSNTDARELARIAEEEDWSGEIHVYEDQREMDMALGTGRQEYGLLSIWWD